MSVPKTTEAWVIEGKNGFDSLKLQKDRPVGEVGDYDCVVQIHAVSLNYRDLIIPKVPTYLPTYLSPFPATRAVISNS